MSEEDQESNSTLEEADVHSSTAEQSVTPITGNAIEAKSSPHETGSSPLSPLSVQIPPLPPLSSEEVQQNLPCFESLFGKEGSAGTANSTNIPPVGACEETECKGHTVPVNFPNPLLVLAQQARMLANASGSGPSVFPGGSSFNAEREMSEKVYQVLGSLPLGNLAQKGLDNNHTPDQQKRVEAVPTGSQPSLALPQVFDSSEAKE